MTTSGDQDEDRLSGMFTNREHRVRADCSAVFEWRPVSYRNVLVTAEPVFLSSLGLQLIYRPLPTGRRLPHRSQRSTIYLSAAVTDADV